MWFTISNMNEFGIALKKARIEAKKKLRDLSEFMKLSIGYLSDIEQGRKAPPDLEIVRKMQEYLSVADGLLATLAEKARTRRPTEVAQQIQERPQLSELFFRVKDMSEEDLKQLINKVSED